MIVLRTTGATRASRPAVVLTALLVALAVALGAPTASAAALEDPIAPDGPAYPVINGNNLEGGTQTSGVFSPSGGVVNLLSNVFNLDPADVVGAAGPTALQGATLLRSDLAGTPLGDTTLASLRLQVLPVEIPLSTIPIARSTAPQTWAEVLEPTVLGGIPLQNVTWRQAWSLSPRPVVLEQVTLDEVDFTGSVLADLPLSALVLGGADVSTIEIPPQAGQDESTPFEDRWCALLNATQAGTCSDPDLLVGSSLIEIGIRGAPLKNIPLKNIPLKNIDLTSSPLKNIPLKNIVLEVAPLKNIPLKNIDLQASPLKNIPLKNIDFATSPLKNIPLKNIDFATSPLKNIPLKNIDFATAPLKNIPLKNIDLAAAGLGALPLDQVDWAAALLGQAGLDQLDASGTLLGPILLSAAASADDIALCDAPTAWCDSDPTIGEAAAAGALLADATLADIGSSGFAGAGTLSDLLAARTAGSTLDPTLGDLRLDLVTGDFGIALGALLAALDAVAPDVLLGDLRLDLATGLDAYLLGAVFAFMLDPELFAAYLLGDVGTYTDGDGRDVTLGDLGVWVDATGAEITLGELAQYLDDSVSLADVLLGLVPASEFPFEDFPVDSLGLNQPGAPVLVNGQFVQSVTTEATIRLGISNPFLATEPVTAEIHLPPGSRFVDIFGYGDADPLSNITSSVLPDGRTRVRATVPSLPTTTILPGIRVRFENPIRLGRVPIQYSLVAADGSVPASSEFDLVLEETAEPNSPDEDFYGPRPTFPTNVNSCSASSPDCAGLDREYIDAMVPGFVDRPGDVDWYVLPNVRAGARVTADLTNLPMDADVVLYGPNGIDVSPTLFPDADAPLPGKLVEDAELGVGQAAASLAAQALSDLQLDQGRIHPGSLEFIPALTPLSVSVHRGSDAEAVGVVAPVDGDYVVAVTGYNAETSDEPYLLRARATNPPAPQACPARGFPHALPAPSTPPTLPTGATALFLTHPGRLAATHGAAAAQTVTTALDDLVGYLGATPDLGIRPAVVPLDAYPQVRDAYAAWDAAPCSVAAANDVAAQVTDVIREVRAASPDLAYVTVVGGDDVVPMGRVPDLTRISNERDYAATFETPNPISAAQAASFTLTDDVYGDTDPVDIGNGGSVFVPRLAVGRLVEKPSEIAALLDAYRTNSGALDTSTGLVAGYDFLADGSATVANRLARPGRSIDDDLIDAPGATDPWGRDDLLTKLFPTDGEAPGVSSLNAHYDHNALLPSLGDSGGSVDLVTAADLTSGGADRLNRRVLFTMGCHAGLAVPDAYLPDGAVDPLAIDWAQALSAQEVSVYVANTGYGIGDTASIAYTERLMGLYSTLLDGSVTAGQALAYAKQAYYGSLGAVGVYDLKILQQTTFYGLPFWGVGTTPPDAGARAAATASDVGTAATLAPPPPPDALTYDTSTGRATATITVEPTFEEVLTDRGRYWQVVGPDGPEDPQVTQHRPILPRTSRSVVVDGLVARGALVTSLEDHEIADVDPVLAAPTVDLSESSPEVRADDATWAAQLATVTTTLAPSGVAQDLVVVPGRFTGGTEGAGGRQRLYDSVGVQVHYALESDEDVTPPELTTSQGVVLGSTLSFRAAVSDGESGVRRVVVGYRDVDGEWRFIDLAPTSDGFSGTAVLAGPLPPGGSVEYFVQAVDVTGNVGLASNKAAGFVAGPVPPQVAGLSVTANTPLPAGGWYAGDVIVTATSSPVAPIDRRLDGGPWILDKRADFELGPIATVIDGEGVRLFEARDPDGRVSGLAVPIDRSDPVVAAPDSQSLELGRPALDAFTCTDAGSGIESCTSTVIDTSTVTATTTSRSYTVTAVDRVGRTTTKTVSYTVRESTDDVPPTITATVTPAPNAAGWNRTDTTVSYDCADTWSGIADGACPAPVTVTDEGEETFTRTVADRKDNKASTSVTVRLDRTAPLVTLTGSIPDAPVCTTTEAPSQAPSGVLTSGVATSATLTRTTTRVDGIPMTTATCSGATDVAGNETPPLSRTYVAPIAFSGYGAPVNAPPIVNVGKAGRAYPLRFSLRDEAGGIISSLEAVSWLSVVTVPCTSLDGAGDPLDVEATGGSGLRWDPVAQEFVYTWKTPKVAGCYRVEVALVDGRTAHSALFRLTG